MTIGVDNRGFWNARAVPSNDDRSSESRAAGGACCSQVRDSGTLSLRDQTVQDDWRGFRGRQRKRFQSTLGERLSMPTRGARVEKAADEWKARAANAPIVAPAESFLTIPCRSVHAFARLQLIQVFTSCELKQPILSVPAMVY